MAIPISYNIRNLRQRRAATVMTALGVALTVATALFILALLDGLRHAFVATGQPLNVLVMRQGSQAEMQSFVQMEAAQVLKQLPGLAVDSNGEPLISGEHVVVINLPRRNRTGEVNVTVRGMGPAGIALRPGVKLTAGRWFQAGQREVVVSETVRKRFAHTDLGDSIEFGHGMWKVVGVFGAAGTAQESEIWGDVNQMAADFDRRDGYSSVLMRAVDAAAADALCHRVSDDQRLKLQGMRETEYYAAQTSSGAPIRLVGTVVAVIMVIGSCFAAMNTMYAAVAHRAREIAILRVLGFSRSSILASFLVESLLLALFGTLIGIVLTLPFNGMMAGSYNIITFSEAVYRVRFSLRLVVVATGLAALMGLFGGLAPAWHASVQNIVVTLRE
jgi:ABC-type lipoprotein release transport system permease subunit